MEIRQRTSIKFMSDKDWKKLWEIDRQIRTIHPTQMWNNNETICTIRFFGGFELFNTRPYHNYESWSEGWEITSGDGKVRVVAEDLDDAVAKYKVAIKKGG